MATENVQTYENGVLVSTSTVTIPLEVENERSILTKAQQAIALNAIYLALAAPTVPQNTAQIKRLTREVNGLLRLLLRELQDVSDT